MVEELTSLGLENQVYVPVYDKTKSSIIPNDNVLVSERFNKWDRLVFDYKQEKIIRDIEEKIDVSSFDLIHAYTLFTDGNCARRLSEKYKIPFVVAVRNTDVNDFFKKMVHLRKRGLRTLLSSQSVFFLSSVYKKKVINSYIPNRYQNEIESKSLIIPNGIDNYWLDNEPEEVDFSQKPHHPINLIFVGVINRNKNIKLIQTAVRLLIKDGEQVKLTVVGRVEDKKLFKEILSDENVIYHPPCKKESLIDLYRENDIFVMVSHHETFGLVYPEAMSQGLPVLYTRGEGFDGQFPDGTIGYSCSDDNPYELAERIKLCIVNYKSQSRMAIKNSKKYSWQSLCDIYACEYDRIKKDMCNG